MIATKTAIPAWMTAGVLAQNAVIRITGQLMMILVVFMGEQKSIMRDGAVMEYFILMLSAVMVGTAVVVKTA